jgi:phage/plasmid-like protein (TIGR03299 family)
MAHNVENMFSVKEVPWHGLGKIVTEAPNVQEAIKIAGLDWSVEKKELFTKDGVLAPEMAVVRDLDKSILGVVGKNWTPVQNIKAFEFFNKFLEQGQATMETAGSLNKGQRIFILARLNRDPMMIAKDDLVNKYILLSNGHDGRSAVRVGFTPIRVVCANTLRMADEHHHSKQIRITHSSKVNDALDLVQQSMDAANQSFEATAEQYRAMLRLRVNKRTLEQFVKVVFGYNTADQERAQTRLDNMTREITKLFETGYGNDARGVKGTGWALYNAATQYLTHEAGNSAETRLNGLWFNGTQAAQNKKAFDFVMSEVAV